MIRKTKLGRLKEILRRSAAALLVIGLLITSYGIYLQSNNVIAQQQTLQSELYINNLSFPDVTSSPYYTNQRTMGVPKQVMRIYSFYGNRTAEVMDTVEVVLPAPVSSTKRAALFTSTYGPKATADSTVQFSNNNGESWTYTPTGEVDGNVTHIKWTFHNVPANTLNRSVQAQFQAPDEAPNSEVVYTAQGYVQSSGIKADTNTVTWRNMTKPEFNKLSEKEVEHTVLGTNDIHTVPTPYTDTTALQMGQEFGIHVYARNVIPETAAQNLKIRLEFPNQYATTHVVKAYLSADNAETLVDTTTFTLPRPGKLRYLTNEELAGRNSCKLTWHGQHQYKLCGNEIATTGYVWTDGPLKFGSAETLQLTVEAIVEEQQATPTPSPTASPIITPTPTPVITASPSPVVTPTPTPVVTATPVITASPSPVVTPTPTPVITASPTPVITSSPTPVVTASPTPVITASPSPVVTASPSATPAQTTQLKICKYEDDNADGIHNNGENVISWSFKAQYNNQTKDIDSHWWYIWSQGCAIETVPADTSITVNEVAKTGWRQTALYADGARVDGSNYTYTSHPDQVKILWFLNTFTPVLAPSATPAPTGTSTPVPSATPSVAPTATPTIAPTATPTQIPTSNSNYNVTIEKRVDGTRVDGDKVGIQYRVKIKNNGDSNFNNFEIKDTLPPDFTYDQNTTEGDINTNPEIQDVSGDDNRRLVWKVSVLEKGKEINFGYRTTGKKEDKSYCNDAKIEKEGNLVSTSQACVRIDKSGDTQVLGVSTTKTLPSTGAVSTTILGLLMLGLAGYGFKLSKHIE